MRQAALTASRSKRSDSTQFYVPAKVQWQCLVLCGLYQLDVDFEDVGAFAKVPMNFLFLSRKPFGRSWLPLDAALVQSKPDWVSMAKQINYRCQCIYNCKYSCYTNQIRALSYEHFPGKFSEGTMSDCTVRCTCRACITCLKCSGSV